MKLFVYKQIQIPTFDFFNCFSFQNKHSNLTKIFLEQLNENKEMIDQYKKELTVIRQISSKKTSDAQNQTVNIVAPMATRVTNKRYKYLIRGKF